MRMRHGFDLPRLYSGKDEKGRPWTCLHLPRAFGERLKALPKPDRANVMRSLVRDFKASL